MRHDDRKHMMFWARVRTIKLRTLTLHPLELRVIMVKGDGVHSGRSGEQEDRIVQSNYC